MKKLSIDFRPGDTRSSDSIESPMATRVGLMELPPIDHTLRYPPDDGPVPEEMLRYLRQTESQENYEPTSTLIKGL
jgi:hypothetical protein